MVECQCCGKEVHEQDLDQDGWCDQCVQDEVALLHDTGVHIPSAADDVCLMFDGEFYC